MSERTVELYGVRKNCRIVGCEREDLDIIGVMNLFVHCVVDLGTLRKRRCLNMEVSRSDFGCLSIHNIQSKFAWN